jgi:anti-sigma regulatory factor (Ser/Thr protein kinase)
MNNNFISEVKNSIPAIADCRVELLKFGRKNKLSKECLFGLVLAVDELLMNIVLYGYKDDREHSIFLEIKIDGENIYVQIVDDGIPFNPQSAPSPDINTPVETRTPGGLGIFLAKNYVNSIDYVFSEGKNRLKLHKIVN